MNRLHNFDDVINYLSQRYKVPLTDRHNAPTYSSIDGISSEATYFKRATVNILVQFQNELLMHVGKDHRNQSTRFKSSNGVKQFEDQQPDQHIQRLHHGHRFPHAAPPPHGGPSSITSPPHHFTSNSMEYSNSDVSSDMAYTYEESPRSHPHTHQRVKQSTGGERETDVYSYDYTEDQSWADRSQCQCPDCNGVRSPKHGHRRGDRNTKHNDDDDTTYPSPMSSPRGEPQRKKDTNGSDLDDHGSVHIQTKQEPQYLKLVASNSGSTMHPSHNTQQQHWVIPAPTHNEQQPHPQQRHQQPQYIHPVTGKPLPEGPPLHKQRNSQSPSSRRVPPPPSTRPALNSFQDLMHRLDSPPIPIRSSQPHHPSPDTNMRSPPGPQHENKSPAMNNYSHPPVETYHDYTPPIKSPSYSLSYSPVYHGQQEVRPYTPPVMNRMSRYHASPLTDANLRPPLRYYDPMNPSMVTTDTQAVPPPPPPPPPVTPTPDAPKGILKPIAQMSSDDSDAASSTHSKEKKKKSSSHSSSSKDKDKDKDKKKKEKHTSSKHHSSKEKDKHHSKSSSSSDKKKKESSREDAHDRDAKKEHHSSSSKSEDQHHHHHHRTGSSHHSSEKKTSSPEKKKSHSHTHHDKKK